MRAEQTICRRQCAGQNARSRKLETKKTGLKAQKLKNIKMGIMVESQKQMMAANLNFEERGVYSGDVLVTIFRN